MSSEVLIEKKAVKKTVKRKVADKKEVSGSEMPDISGAIGDLVEKLKETPIKKSLVADEPSVKAKPKVEKPKSKMSTSKMITLNDYFEVHSGTYELLKRNIRGCVNTMLIGPTGTGKTELVSNIAKELGVSLTIFDMGTMTDPIMGLVGTHTISVKDGKTYSEFKQSRFSDVIQKPGIVLLDEISRAAAAANNLLFPVLDYRRELSMEYSFHNPEPIKVHPECVFFATANMGSQYTGTHKLDRALIDRFFMVEVDQLDHSQLRVAITKSFPELDANKIKYLVETYSLINKEHDDYKISFNLSIRHLKQIAQMVQDGFTLYDGFYIICKGMGGSDGLKALEVILSSIKAK